MVCKKNTPLSHIPQKEERDSLKIVLINLKNIYIYI